MGALVSGLLDPFGSWTAARDRALPAIDVFRRPGSGDGFVSALGWDAPAGGGGGAGQGPDLERGGEPGGAASCPSPFGAGLDSDCALEMSRVEDWPSSALLRAPVAYRQALPQDVMDALRDEEED
jgi:hypothetical protein